MDRRLGIPRQVARFYAIAFAMSWLGWMPALLRQWHVVGFGSVLWLGLTVPGALGPAVAAWVVDRGAFLSFRKRIAWPWLVVAAAAPLMLVLLTDALSRFGYSNSSVEPVRGRALAWVALMAVGANVWEEVGWRASALQRLQELVQPWTASLIVGVLWALWHLPLLYSGWSGMQDIPAGWWALRVVGTSVIMAWLWNRTVGSIWGVVIFHIASNVGSAFFGVCSFRVEAVIVWCLAAALLYRSHGKLGT